MSSTLRVIAVAGCTATLITTGFVTGVSPSIATAPPAFTATPSFGPVGSTVTLTGPDFTGDTSATIHGVSATAFTLVNAHKVTIVVPSGATTGPVVVTGATTLTGPSFTVQQATTARAVISRTNLQFASPLTVTGTLTKTVGGGRVHGQTAVLQHRLSGSSAWHHATGTPAKSTGAAGRVLWVVKPSASGRYRIHFRASHSYAGVTTTSSAVHVSPQLHNRSIHVVPVLSPSLLKGSIHPHLAGVVYLQKSVNGKWVHAGHQKLVGGRYSFSITPKSYGKLRYRVVWHNDGLHAHAVSTSIKLQVVKRELSLGDTGPDVYALLKRLHTLHYDTGPVSSTYGTDALHAVTAFEKVNGLAKNGMVTTAVWSKLNHPAHAHLHHPDPNAALAVEVNKTKQILLLAKHGKIWKILDTSTAGGYLYKDSEGQTERAETPDGHFSVQYKITGWHKSKLGELYYPSYFTNTGYAIHGEGNGNDSGEVPPYAASHGCVRISNNAVLRYYNMLTVGTSVWIYG